MEQTDQIAAVDTVLTQPIGFITEILGLALYDWQDRALAPLEITGRRQKIAVRTPNGSGKSERIVAGAALYWVGIHPKGTVVITTKDGRQLDEQIWPAINRHKQKFEGWKFQDRYVESPTGGRIIGFTTDDAGRAEGWHKLDDVEGPLLFIVDEAKSIEERIFQAIDRCTWNTLLMTSSPGVKMGRFFEAFTKNRADYICVEVGLKDCPHIPQEKINDIIKTYGEDHPFTRSSVFGEFMDEDDMNKFAVPLESVLRCLRNPPAQIGSEVVVFCDFADGGDENVIAVRKGNKVTIEAAWREKGKHGNVGRFITHFRRLGFEPQDAARFIWCDASDKEMADLLADAGWRVNRINFGSQARNSDMYISWSAEAWLEGALQIERCAVILPDDEALKAQFSTRQKGINARGKFFLEDKKEMSKRGISSPDRADAVLGALAVKEVRAIQTNVPVFSVPDEFSDEHVDAQELAGAWAGD